MYSKIDGGPMRARYDITTCTDAAVYAKVVSDEWVLFLYMIASLSKFLYSPTRTIHLCPLFWSAPLIGMDSQVSCTVSVYFKPHSF